MIDKNSVETWQVLVVDDEPDSLEIVSRILSYHGARVETVAEGMAALEALDRLTPTLIIMDLSMPDMDGWEVLYHLRNNPRLRSVPMVALTAHAMKGDRERALDAGFYHYLTKPLNPLSFFDDLLAALANGSHASTEGRTEIEPGNGAQTGRHQTL